MTRGKAGDGFVAPPTPPLPARGRVMEGLVVVASRSSGSCGGGSSRGGGALLSAGGRRGADACGAGE
jgi:hypothetical protein